MLGLKKRGADVVALGGPLIKAAEFAALATGEQIVAEAQRDAEAIVHDAERVREAARLEGHRVGLEQGKQEMAEQLIATAGQTAAYLEQLEAALVQLVVKATRRVLGEMPEEERVTRIVHEALQLLRDQQQVKIKVPPAQRHALQRRFGDLLAEFPRIKFLDLEADATLPADGCVLETELGVIDASVETQLRAIEKALVASLQ